MGVRLCVQKSVAFWDRRPRRSILLFNNFFRNQGLGGSRCGSVTVRFKHHTVVFFIAAPPLRYLISRGSKSEVLPRADCPLANKGLPF